MAPASPKTPRYIVDSFRIYVRTNSGAEERIFYAWSDGVITWKDGRND